MPMNVCIYHANCLDGMAAAFAVKMYYGDDVVLIPMSYGTPVLPEFDKNTRLILVDFSFKRDVMVELAPKVKEILVLDHHESAERELVELPSNVFVKFDMERSGCRLAWECFMLRHGPMPRIFEHIEDRDLWKFELEKTKEICAALFSYPMDFVTWQHLIYGKKIEELILEGETLIRDRDKRIEAALDSGMVIREIASYEVPTINVSPDLVSEVGHKLCKGYPFAAMYYDTPDGRKVSLRSDENGINVAKIAEQFGGGGHEHAAGYPIPNPIIDLNPKLEESPYEAVV